MEVLTCKDINGKDIVDISKDCMDEIIEKITTLLADNLEKEEATSQELFEFLISYFWHTIKDIGDNEIDETLSYTDFEEVYFWRIQATKNMANIDVYQYNEEIDEIERYIICETSNRYDGTGSKIRFEYPKNCGGTVTINKESDFLAHIDVLFKMCSYQK